MTDNNIVAEKSKQLLEIDGTLQYHKGLLKEKHYLAKQLRMTECLAEFYLMLWNNFKYNRFTSAQVTELCKDKKFKVRQYNSIMAYIFRLDCLNYLRKTNGTYPKQYQLIKYKALHKPTEKELKRQSEPVGVAPVMPETIQ